MRRNPKLAVTSKIEYPRDQQVKYIVEVWTAKKRKEDTTGEKRAQQHENSDDAAAAAEEFEKAFQNHTNISTAEPARNNDKTEKPSTSEVASTPTSTERDKVIVKNVRQAHSAWDRAERDFKSMVERSENHENTRGCKFESDLKGHVEAGKKLDQDVVAFELKFLGGHGYTKEDVPKAAALCKRLDAEIKAGQKKVIALKPWFAIKG